MTVKEVDGGWLCPDCRNAYSNNGIANHWTKSSECDWPVPDEMVRELLVGLYFSDGHIYTQGEGEYPNLEKSTVVQEAAEWLAGELGFWSYGVKVDKPDPEAFNEFLSERYGRDADYDVSDRFTIRTRVTPFVRAIQDMPTFDIRMAPLSAAAVYAFKGHPVGGDSEHAKSAIAFSSGKPRELASWFVGNGYPLSELSVYGEDPGKSKQRLTISSVESRRFFSFIEDHVIPGFESKWDFEFSEEGTWQGPKPTRRLGKGEEKR